MANFSFDYDGCMSLQPEAFAAFSDALRAAGHKTYIVTMKYPSECDVIEPFLKSFDGLHATSRMAKKPFMENLGIAIHVWLEDTPRSISEDAVSIWGFATREGETHTPDHKDIHNSPEIPPQATLTGSYNRSGPTGTAEECMAVAMRGLWRSDPNPHDRANVIETDSPAQAHLPRSYNRRHPVGSEESIKIAENHRAGHRDWALLSRPTEEVEVSSMNTPEGASAPKVEPTLDKVLLEFEDDSHITVLQKSTECSLPLVKIAEIAKSENTTHLAKHWLFKHVVDFGQTYGVSEVWLVSAALLERVVEPFTKETVTHELAILLCCPKTYGVVSEFYKKKLNIDGKQLIELIKADPNSGHLAAFTAASLIQNRLISEVDWPWE